MSFAVHTFETHPDGSNTAFAFHEHLGEGQKVYFLAKFSSEMDSAPVPTRVLTRGLAEKPLSLARESQL